MKLRAIPLFLMIGWVFSTIACDILGCAEYAYLQVPSFPIDVLGVSITAQYFWAGYWLICLIIAFTLIWIDDKPASKKDVKKAVKKIQEYIDKKKNETKEEEIQEEIEEEVEESDNENNMVAITPEGMELAMKEI